MPTEDTLLPEHAIDEIKAAKGKDRAELETFWASWAAVGDAKQAERSAFQEVVDAQVAFAACRAKLQAKHPGKSLPPEACDCGRHYRPAVKAQHEREKAKAAIERTIRSFKDGR